MPQARLRLAAGMALLGFLVSNYLVVGHARLPYGTRSCACSAASATEPAAAEPERSGCKHCRAKNALPETERLQLAQLDIVEDSAPDDRCPCQRGGDPCPHCPAGPGGCMFCNVAKVPCHLPSFGFMVSPPRLIVGYFIDSDQLFTASPCSKLFRPPRA